MLHNLFTVALLIAVTIAVASALILIAGSTERPRRDARHAPSDRVGFDHRGANDG